MEAGPTSALVTQPSLLWQRQDVTFVDDLGAVEAPNQRRGSAEMDFGEDLAVAPISVVLTTVSASQKTIER